MWCCRFSESPYIRLSCRLPECGIGTFGVRAADVALSYIDTNWIFYEFDWSND
jgi:hypothetical protein